jgi:hypothetical protein
MEAIGALVIFFSWIVTNALTQRYNSLKQSLESVQGTFRLYNTLHELRSMINSLALEVIQGLPKGLNATRFRAGRHHIDDVEAMRENFCLERVSAHQVRELLDFMTQTHGLAKTIGNDTTTSKEVLNQLLEVQELRDRLKELEIHAEEELAQSNSFENKKRFSAIPAYIRFYKQEVLPRVPEFYARIVELSNIAQAKGQEALRRASQHARIARFASLVLYATGTLLIVSSKLIGNGS